MNKLGLIFLLLLSHCIFAQFNIENLEITGRKQVTQNQFAEAIKTFNTILNFKPDMFEIYILRGIAKYNLGDLKGAELDFSRTIEKNPYSYEAFHFRGVTRERNANHMGAMLDFDRAIKLDSLNPAAFFSRGISHTIKKNYNQALKDYNTAIRLKKDYYEAYLNRAIIKGFTGDTINALHDFNKAIQLNPLSTDAYCRRGLFFYDRNKLTDALSDLNKSIKLDKFNTFAYYCRANAKYKIPDYNGAIEDYTKVTELDPGNALAYYNMAQIKAYIGAYNAAIDDYEKASTVNPNNILAHYNRALVKFEIKDYKSAIGDLNNAIKLMPDFVAAYKARAEAKFRTNDKKGAAIDDAIANDITCKYEKSKKDSTLANYIDTTKLLNTIIDFDASFDGLGNGLVMEGRIQDKMVNIDLIPPFELIVINKADSLKPAKQYYSKHVDELNKKMGNNQYYFLSNEIDSLYKLKLSSTQSFKEPKTWMEQFNKATLLNSLGDYSDAINLFSNCVPSESFALFSRACIKYKIASVSQDIGVQTSGLDKGKNTSDYSLEKEKNQMLFDAVTDFTKAIELMPDNPYIYYNRALVFCTLNDLKNALEDFSKAISLKNDLAEAWFNRGLTNLYMKQNDEGCTDLSHAGELGLTESYAIIKRFCRQ